MHDTADFISQVTIASQVHTQQQSINDLAVLECQAYRLVNVGRKVVEVHGSEAGSLPN